MRVRDVLLGAVAVGAAIAGCGGRLADQPADAGPPIESSVDACQSECPAPTKVHRGQACLNWPQPCPALQCPSNDGPVPPGGQPFLCTCQEALWYCDSAALPGYTCPAPEVFTEVVGQGGWCNDPTNVTCPIPSSTDVPCLCKCDGWGSLECNAGQEQMPGCP